MLCKGRMLLTANNKSMLREIRHVRQIAGEPLRRWFCDRELDLIVWLDEARRVVGFQLCYDKERDERALCWHPQSGYQHSRVDNGEARPGRYKAAPLLVPGGRFDGGLIRQFIAKSLALEPALSGFIHRKLVEFASRGSV